MRHLGSKIFFLLLKMLRIVPALRALVLALVNSVGSILYVCILMMLVFYIVAIFCMVRMLLLVSVVSLWYLI